MVRARTFMFLQFFASTSHSLVFLPNLMFPLKPEESSSHGNWAEMSITMWGSGNSFPSETIQIAIVFVMLLPTYAVCSLPSQHTYFEYFQLWKHILQASHDAKVACLGFCRIAHSLGLKKR